MSSSSKIITWVIVILIIVIGGIIYFTHTANQGTYPGNSASSTDNGLNGVPPRNYDDGSNVSATDTSNAALDSDMSNVDGQMNDLNGDSSSADAGMNASSTQ